MAPSTHILFVLDDYSEVQGGAYSLERGIVKLVQKCSQHDSQVKISCTTCKFQAEYDGTFPQNITLIRPTPTQNDATIEDLNQRDLHFYRNLEEHVIGVTHVVVFASHTLGCALSGGLVERVFKSNKTKPRVIVINNDDSATAENLDSLNLSENNLKPLYISLAGSVFDRSRNLISNYSNSGTYHKILYPYFEEIRGMLLAAPEPPVRTITSFVQGCFRQSIPKQCAESSIDVQLLKKCSECIEKLQEELKDNDHRNEIKWVIYFDYCSCTKSKKELIESIDKNLANTNIGYTVEVLSEIDKKTFEKTVCVTNLCIANGNFDGHMYSGLESLLSGMPTFTLKDSDTFNIMKEIDQPKAGFFSLDMKDDNSKWLESFRSVLNSGNSISEAFKDAKEFAYKYYRRPTVKDSLREFTELFFADASIENILDQVPNESRQRTDSAATTSRYPSTTEDPDITFKFLNVDIRSPDNFHDPDETGLKYMNTDDETLLKERTDGFIQTDGPHSDQGNIFQRLEHEVSMLSPVSPTPVFDDVNDVIASNNTWLRQGARPKQSIPQYDITQRNAPYVTTNRTPMSYSLQNKKEQPFKEPAHSSRGTNARSTGESDNSSSDESDNSRLPLPRVSTPPMLTFTTKKQPRSSLSKKINKIKRESQKPVKKRK